MDVESQSRGLVLIVDDTPSAIQVARSALEEAGYRVAVATDGRRGLQRAAKVAPDVILLDILMPGMDGYEACRRLKAQEATAHVPVLLLSALLDTQDKVKGFEAGAVDYLTKPVAVEELLARVGTHVALSHLTKELQASNRLLEERVAARTAELREANAALLSEIGERRHAEQRLMEHRQRLRALASELVLTEEREKRRLAEALHDGVGQTLAFCKMKLECLHQDIDDPSTAQEMAELQETLAGVLEQIRSVTFELSSPVLRDLGLSQAVSTWLKDRVEKAHHVQTEFVDDGLGKPLTDDLRMLVFRCVRELLANVIKHARATWTRVSLERVGEQLSICVEDDGVGPSAEVLAHGVGSQGFGLFSIREGLDAAGGCLRLEARSNGGTRVILEVPLHQTAT